MSYVKSIYSVTEQIHFFLFTLNHNTTCPSNSIYILSIHLNVINISVDGNTSYFRI